MRNNNRASEIKKLIIICSMILIVLPFVSADGGWYLKQSGYTIYMYQNQNWTFIQPWLYTTANNSVWFNYSNLGAASEPMWSAFSPSAVNTTELLQNITSAKQWCNALTNISNASYANTCGIATNATYASTCGGTSGTGGGNALAPINNTEFDNSTGYLSLNKSKLTDMNIWVDNSTYSQQCGVASNSTNADTLDGNHYSSIAQDTFGGNSSNVLTNITKLMLQMQSLPNLSYSNVTSNVGNWSADKNSINATYGGIGNWSSYAPYAVNGTQLAANISATKYWCNALTNITNASYALTAGMANFPTCSSTDKLTYNGNTLSCATDQTGGGGGGGNALAPLNNTEFTNSSGYLSLNHSLSVAIPIMVSNASFAATCGSAGSGGGNALAPVNSTEFINNTNYLSLNKAKSQSFGIWVDNSTYSLTCGTATNATYATSASENMWIAFSPYAVNQSELIGNMTNVTILQVIVNSMNGTGNWSADKGSINQTIANGTFWGWVNVTIFNKTQYVNTSQFLANLSLFMTNGSVVTVANLTNLHTTNLSCDGPIHGINFTTDGGIKLNNGLEMNNRNITNSSQIQSSRFCFDAACTAFINSTCYVFNSGGKIGSAC